MKNIKLIEVPSEIGAGTRGASLGVEAIRIAALDFMSNFFIHFPSEKITTENKLLYEPIESPWQRRSRSARSQDNVENPSSGQFSDWPARLRAPPLVGRAALRSSRPCAE